MVLHSSWSSPDFLVAILIVYESDPTNIHDGFRGYPVLGTMRNIRLLGIIGVRAFLHVPYYPGEQGRAVS